MDWLFGTVYEGEKLYLLIFDDRMQRIRREEDKTGYLPYFLVKEPPEYVCSLPLTRNGRDPVERVELVDRIDPVTKKSIKMTKIVVKNPLDVADIRKFFTDYESHIQFYQNYILDMQIRPGLPWPQQDMPIEQILETPVPNLKMVAIDIEVYMENRAPDVEKADQPVISIALYGDGIDEVLVLDRWGKGYIKTEKELLEKFWSIVSRYPVVITFNGQAFDWPYLVNRSRVLGVAIPRWDFIHLDLYTFFSKKSIQNYAFDGAYQEYSLDAIASALLGKEKVKHEESIARMSDELLIKYNRRDAMLTYELATFNDRTVIKLIFMIARLAVTGLQDVVDRDISNWIKNLLLFEHRKRNWLIPRQEDLGGSFKTVSEEGKKFRGAIVLDPPVGVFENVVVLDFASLYPTIIKEFNISYETVDRECQKKENIYDEEGNVIHTVCMDSQGIMSYVIGLIRDLRVNRYKKLAKQGNHLAEIVQRTLKVFINAFYGVSGNEQFQFFYPPMAESVTSMGRYIFTQTRKFVEEHGVRVLYGDTDSLFLHNPPEELVKEVMNYVKTRFHFDIEVDKVFRYIIFAGLKKNYIGVKGNKIDIKGMGLKKRNTPNFIRKAVKHVEEVMLNNPPSALKDKIGEIIVELHRGIDNNEYNLDDLAFYVMLTKDSDEYKVESQHLKAVRMLQMVGVEVKQHDIVGYVKTVRDVEPIQLAKLKDIDKKKYHELIDSTFEPLMLALGIPKRNKTIDQWLFK